VAEVQLDMDMDNLRNGGEWVAKKHVALEEKHQNQLPMAMQHDSLSKVSPRVLCRIDANLSLRHRRRGDSDVMDAWTQGGRRTLCRATLVPCGAQLYGKSLMHVHTHIHPHVTRMTNTHYTLILHTHI
jgi:hypothetical protein